MLLKENGIVTKKKFINVEIENIRIKMQLDTGSDITIVNEETWKFIGKPKLSKSTKSSTRYYSKELVYTFCLFFNLHLHATLRKYAFSHDGCWAALVADILQRKCDVINRGFSGYNSRWCKKILSSVLNKNELKDAVFVTIFLGANDCADEKINPLQHVPVDEYKNNMVEMVQMLQVKVLLYLN
eukprot:XP_014787263.1 PREDICTED: isoamyl acetate-hydrolyzing esterase 1 homolog [Octopus bimaculoides]